MNQVAAENAAKFLFITEPHHIEGPNWYQDTYKRAVIVNAQLSPVEEIGQQEPRFCWISSGSVRMYSCYWSPNSSFPDFLDFLTRLELSIRTACTEVLITGDFNSHHTDWGSRVSDRRGHALSDLINCLGLTISNKGQSPTFERRNQLSIIDFTLASTNLAARITD